MVSTTEQSHFLNTPTTEVFRSLSLPRYIENPVTGDRLTVLRSSRESHGESFKTRFDLPPGAKGSPLHYHTTMTETFEVLSGALEMELGKKGNKKTLQPGDIVQVPVGMHHSFRNASNEWVSFTTEVRPAARFEQFMRALYGLAVDGKVNQEGTPTNLLQLALIVERADTIFVGPPLLMQKLLIGALAGIARFLRVEQSLVKYWSEAE
jgi:quercetin dioxygenase-like cupin family protein